MTKVFISYSHDSDEHREWVLGLSERLRQDGIVTILDRYVENGSPPKGWPLWMLDSLDEAPHVLCVCTETYYRRFRGFEVPGKGKGVDWEGTMITQALYNARSVSSKFIAVLCKSDDEPYIPEPLRPRAHYVLSSEGNYQALYDALLNQGGVKPGNVGPLKIKPHEDVKPLNFDAQPQLTASQVRAREKKFLYHSGDLDQVDQKSKPIRDPEYLLGLLDRKPQHVHFDYQIPEKRPVDEGKAYGFCIFGPRNEWPNAVRFTLSHLLEEHKISYSKHSPEIKPLETRLNLTNNSAELLSIGETHLWKLLGRRLDCRSEKTDILKILQSKEESHIFFRELAGDEVKNHNFIAGVLLAWSKLTFGVNSHSHFLLLICESDYLSDSRFSRLFHKRSSSRWYEDLQKLLSRHQLQNSLLPTLCSPTVAEDIEDWFKNHEMPEHLRSTIRKELPKHSAIPLGDLKEKLLPILQKHHSH
ncbi:SEFIR domain-containing protein [Nitrosomonas sp.]|uniref:SEFIR domain-containing protein n=1 Tax=Nitrosomonas sp. TaxID=42353 RepID=UPI0025FBAF96|nr:SEFIR domain-containing protein [Nitrosomonas sp.]